MTDDVALFEKAVKHDRLNFADWAGAEEAGMSDRDIVGRSVHPDGGDTVVFDTRGRTGFIGIHHDNWSDIHPVKIKNAKDKGYNLRLKKIPRRVSTVDLIKRYLWITNVFLNWLHAEGGSPYMVWKTPEEIETAFRAEAEDFADDPHLALYWVMHFGLCDDPRFAEVAQMVRALGHDQSMDKMRIALAFFDAAGVEHDIDLTPSYNPDGKDYSRLFLRRRANLLYMTYGQSFRGDGVIDPVWQSVSLYRAGDDYAIIRMRWLRNTLEKYDLWGVLEDRLNDVGNDDIPFIAYPRIFQPNQTDRSALADGLVGEVMATRQMWSNRYSDFGKAILHDIREHIVDQKAFRAAAVVVFDGDMGDPRFADILASVGEEGFGDEITREKLAAYERLFEGVRSLVTTDGLMRIDAIFAEADALLSELDRSEMVFFVGATTQRDARRVLLRHVLLNDAADREDHIVSLFPRAAFRDHELKHFFEDPHPPVVKARDDTVARAMLRVLDLPEEAFAAEHKRKDAVEAVCDLMRRFVHEPPIFDHVVEAIQREGADVVATALLESMFKVARGTDYAPLAHLSTQQATRLMRAAVADAKRNPSQFRKGMWLTRECAEQHPETVCDPAAPLVQELLAFTHTPDAAFRAPLDRKDGLETVFDTLRPAVEVPAVFDTLIELVASDTPEGVALAIFGAVFRDYHYEPERNPIPKLDKAQVERVLDAALSFIEAIPKDPKDPLRTIKGCNVPAAKDWLMRTRADTALFKRLEQHRHNFVPLSQKLERALDRTLEDIAEQG